MDDNLSDYYVKLGVTNEFVKELNNINYLMRELRELKNSLASYRQRKAELRKELYEMLISLRLGSDRMKRLLPEHDINLLKKKLEEIKRYGRKTSEKKAKKQAKVKSKKAVKQKEEKKTTKKKSKRSELLESEKRELELLKRDLENITKELKRRE